MDRMIEKNKQWIEQTWIKLDKKLVEVAKRNKGKLPYTTKDGVYDDRGNKHIHWWTNGFWPGLMWLMYVGTKNEVYKEVAENGEELLDKAFENYEELYHDVGFMWLITSGVNYRLTGNKKSKNRTQIAAGALASRYNLQGQFIRAWNNWGQEDQSGWAIIDCMMNLPLLYWASKEANDPRFRYIAESHADKTIAHHIRPDGSAKHIVHYDINNGVEIEEIGGQGYGEGSSWSRGQSWALYGFILSYIHTGKQAYLDTAKKIAHYFIANVCDDWLPKCDFRSPNDPVVYDSTAGAIAACGLIEIAKAVPEYEQKIYIKAAINILKAMEEKFCDWSDNEDSILQMGTERYHTETARHIPIIYGDYYFAEAIYKLKGFDILFW